MMGPGFGEAIGEAMVKGVILLMLLAACIGGLAIWGLPKVWVWLKPIIHAVTA